MICSDSSRRSSAWSLSSRQMGWYGVWVHKWFSCISYRFHLTIGKAAINWFVGGVGDCRLAAWILAVGVAGCLRTRPLGNGVEEGFPGVCILSMTTWLLWLPGKSSQYSLPCSVRVVESLPIGLILWPHAVSWHVSEGRRLDECSSSRIRTSTGLLIPQNHHRSPIACMSSLGKLDSWNTYGIVGSLRRNIQKN